VGIEVHDPVAVDPDHVDIEAHVLHPDGDVGGLWEGQRHGRPGLDPVPPAEAAGPGGRVRGYLQLEDGPRGSFDRDAARIG